MSSDFPMYALSEEHQAIREAVRAVCDAKVAPYAADVDENARYPQEAADALLALTGPAAASPQILVEVRQLGGAFSRPGEHPSAFASRAAAYSLLTVGIAEVPGVEDHAAAILSAMDPWVGGHRLPNFTFTPEEYVDAYDEVTLARLRRAIRTYDPDGVMTIGGVLA